jgi:hypothetical protein
MVRIMAAASRANDSNCTKPSCVTGSTADRRISIGANLPGYATNALIAIAGAKRQRLKPVEIKKAEGVCLLPPFAFIARENHRWRRGTQTFMRLVVGNRLQFEDCFETAGFVLIVQQHDRSYP